ncbi:MAG TPA: CHASE domain-containing protein [Polyangiaceae bacterium]|nr:CHASE domain-containing protein [Polyangiaceae bacterium]
MLALALSFTAGGFLSLVSGLVVRGPTGQTAIVWLPGAIALAGLLRWGRSMWPGVWLGALVLDGVMSSLEAPALPFAPHAVVTLVLSGAMTVQALAAATWLERRVDPSLALDRPRAVLGFLLAAVVTSLIASTIGSATLVLVGVRRLQNLAYDWPSWWASEAIGTFLVTPVLLAWTAEPAHVWRPRRFQVTVPLVLSLVLSATAFNNANRIEEERARAALELRVDHLSVDLENELAGVGAEARAFGELVRLDGDRMTDTEFRGIAARIRARRSSISGVGWVKLVSGAERDAYEAQQGAIRELSPSGTVPAAARPEYWPIEFVAGPGTESLPGVDLASVPGRGELLDAARRSGDLVMSRPVELQGTEVDALGTLIAMPVYANGTRDDARQAPLGWVVFGVRAAPLFRGLVGQPSVRGLAVRVVDRAAASGLLFASSGVETTASSLPYRSTREVKSGGRTWSVTTVPTEAYLRASRSWLAPAISAAGLVFAALLCGFLLVITGNAATTRFLVAERTQELSATNQQLREVIAVQERTGQALKESEARLQFAVEEAGNGMWDLDLTTHELYCSPRVLELLGYGQEESAWTLERWNEAVHPEDAADARHQFELHLAGETATYACEMRMARRDGTYIWFLVKGKIVGRDAAGRALRIIGTQIDISDRKRSEQELECLVQARTQELELAKAGAEAANRTKSAFLANMSHELRTPMHAVLAYARLALEAKLGPREHGFVLRIVESGERLLALLNDLLDLSKLEAGKVRVELAPHDLEALVREVGRELEPLILDRGLTLAVERAATCKSVTANVDRVRMAHVFRNLLANAVRFSAPGGKLCVRFAEPESKDLGPSTTAALAIDFIDEGIGIPEGELELIFDSFVQSSKTHTAAGGTGLGLAICRQIAALHGGVVRAHNNARGGATFTVTLPNQLAGAEPAREVA